MWGFCIVYLPNFMLHILYFFVVHVIKCTVFLQNKLCFWIYRQGSNFNSFCRRIWSASLLMKTKYNQLLCMFSVSFSLTFTFIFGSVDRTTHCMWPLISASELTVESAHLEKNIHEFLHNLPELVCPRASTWKTVRKHLPVYSLWNGDDGLRWRRL